MVCTRGSMYCKYTWRTVVTSTMNKNMDSRWLRRVLYFTAMGSRFCTASWMETGVKAAKRNSSTSRMAFKATALSMHSVIEVVLASHRMPAMRSSSAMQVRMRNVNISILNLTLEMPWKASSWKIVRLPRGMCRMASTESHTLRSSLKTQKLQRRMHSMQSSTPGWNQPTSNCDCCKPRKLLMSSTRLFCWLERIKVPSPLQTRVTKLVPARSRYL
mmetsp:Transcript_19038/g.45179  ORF Transcript_19038/g.45179 Transcript_19038/m.45179 type:complete len:216 (+) Transcript_19038:921-1568(+)